RLGLDGTFGAYRVGGHLRYTYAGVRVGKLPKLGGVSLYHKLIAVAAGLALAVGLSAALAWASPDIVLHSELASPARSLAASDSVTHTKHITDTDDIS